MIDFRLYLISDRKLFAGSESFLVAMEEALKGGVRAVQLREKDLAVRELLEMAYRLRETTKRYGAKLFINDRVDIALAVDADGVHLGHTGLPPQAARKAAGEGLLIGVSAHSIEQAKKAEQDGADFMTLGPVYETPSKLRYGRPLGADILKMAKDIISIPVFAIGGIKEDKADEVMQAGAYGIAVISGIFRADNIKLKSEEFMRLMK